MSQCETESPAGTRQADDDRPTTIAFRGWRPPYTPLPMPLNSQVMHLDRLGRVVDLTKGGTIPEIAHTIVALTWLVDDARRCHRCPEKECNASRSDLGVTALCMKKVRGYVPTDKAESFHRFAGLTDEVGPDQRSGTMS